jgi:hypothetical protein
MPCRHAGEPFHRLVHVGDAKGHVVEPFDFRVVYSIRTLALRQRIGDHDACHGE